MEKTTQIPAVMVLRFEPSLTHSLWSDLYHRCRSLSGLESKLRKMTIAQEIVGYRLISIHDDVIGLKVPLSNREFSAIQKRRGDAQ